MSGLVDLDRRSWSSSPVRESRHRLEVLAVPDRVFEQASQGRLRELAGLTADHIAAAARRLVSARAGDASRHCVRIGPSGQLDSPDVRGVLRRSAGCLPGACEDVVNPLSGAPSLPAPAGPAVATDLSELLDPLARPGHRQRRAWCCPGRRDAAPFCPLSRPPVDLERSLQPHRDSGTGRGRAPSLS